MTLNLIGDLDLTDPANPYVDGLEHDVGDNFSVLQFEAAGLKFALINEHVDFILKYFSFF